MNFGKAKVFVNGVEVPNSPVETPVRVEVEEPLPPLPMRELPAFTEKPTCRHCRSAHVEIVFWPRYHDACASEFYVHAPVNYYSGGLYGPSPEERREQHRQWAEVARLRNTMPAHHDVRCGRCGFGWVMADGEED